MTCSFAALPSANDNELQIPFVAVQPIMPRFLEYERTGRSFPSWNWAPLAAPGVWAFYRRLWWAGTAFSAWPFFALAAVWAALPRLEIGRASCRERV